MAHHPYPNISNSESYLEDLSSEYYGLSQVPPLRRIFLEYCIENPDADECRLYED